MLVGLDRQFMSTQMISFAMGDRSGGVGVGGKVVEFCDPIVRALGHVVLLGG